MGKVRKFLKGKSIKRAFTLSMLACIFSGILLSLSLSGFCQWLQSLIYGKYKAEYGISGDGMMIGFENMEEDGPKIGISYEDPTDVFACFTPRDLMLYDALGILSGGVYPLCFLCCMAVTGNLFYKRQLQEPLAILEHAAGQIAENSLDFQVVYGKEDELGKLCVSFEKMRKALQEGNEEMWRQMEERKRLNAAFSHDLRTPLTVLKGQSELLMRYAPKMTAEKVANTAEMMHRHIERLEAYTQAMGELQRLEDIEVKREPASLDGICRQIRETGEAVCGEKAFSCAVAGDGEAVFGLDAGIVLRVCENLLSNAARFAREKVQAVLEGKEGYVYLKVEDDGKGFAKKDLENATKAFYKAGGGEGQEHFGMGLHICKVLCEKHGGCMRVGNKEGDGSTAGEKGGAVAVASFKYIQKYGKDSK